MWMTSLILFFIFKETDSGLVDFLWWKNLIDKCDEGDILGLRPFFAKDNYLMDAMAREEFALCYSIAVLNACFRIQKFLSFIRKFRV
jgi:hypothetical protein